MASVEVLIGPERRRRWSVEQKRAIVAAAFAPGAVAGGGASDRRDAELTTQGPYAGLLMSSEADGAPCPALPWRAVCPIAWSLRAPRSLRGSVQLTLERSKRV